VAAQLVGPDGTAHILEAAVKHDPGTYTFPFGTFDKEGAWKWTVTATDDLGRVSTADRTFRYDRTLQALKVTGNGQVAFTLTRAATVKVQIETTGGIVVRTLPGGQLAAGAQTAAWDGQLDAGTRAYSGTYVAHVFATTASGTSDLVTQFSYKRR
jgi:hypothetical protein